jgi:flagellar biosynthesis/type III secretory pathway M-ring protein FliF/YscJ
MISASHKKKAAIIEAQNQQQLEALQAELEEKNKTLAEQALEHQSGKDDTVQQIRDFVKDNPEITAGLIRSMIKGDE